MNIIWISALLICCGVAVVFTRLSLKEMKKYFEVVEKAFNQAFKDTNDCVDKTLALEKALQYEREKRRDFESSMERRFVNFMKNNHRNTYCRNPEEDTNSEGDSN